MAALNSLEDLTLFAIFIIIIIIIIKITIIIIIIIIIIKIIIMIIIIIIIIIEFKQPQQVTALDSVFVLRLCGQCTCGYSKTHTFQHMGMLEEQRVQNHSL